MPAVLTVGFYFEKWRALATGLALCGSGVGTFAMAPITEKLSGTIGWKGTMLVTAGLFPFDNLTLINLLSAHESNVINTFLPRSVADLRTFWSTLQTNQTSPRDFSGSTRR